MKLLHFELGNVAHVSENDVLTSLAFMNDKRSRKKKRVIPFQGYHMLL